MYIFLASLVPIIRNTIQRNLYARQKFNLPSYVMVAPLDYVVHTVFHLDDIHVWASSFESVVPNPNDSKQKY